MKIYKFIIIGNQENLKGNPIPYHRTTQRAKYSPQHKRYMDWCVFVRQAYFSQVNNQKLTWSLLSQKPLTTTKEEKARMDILIEYANESHGDGDNIFKGIADAMFENDKYLVAGSFESKQSADKVGRVEVIIKYN